MLWVPVARWVAHDPSKGAGERPVCPDSNVAFWPPHDASPCSPESTGKGIAVVRSKGRVVDIRSKGCSSSALQASKFNVDECRQRRDITADHTAGPTHRQAHIERAHCPGRCIQRR
jgi:hypothetical protein